MKKITPLLFILLSMNTTAQVAAGQYALQRKNVGAGFSLIPLTPTADNIWTFNGSGGLTSIPRNTFALSGHIHALNDLSDVTITAPALNDVLQWNGSAWVNAVVSGGGDVVGPASSTDNNVPQWDGTTGKLLKDGLGVSQGGNGAADANKLVQFKSDGGIGAATGLLSGPALYGETGALNQPGIQGYSTNGGEGGRFQSVGGDGVSGSSNTGAGIRGTNSGTTNPPLHINNTDATNAAPLGWLHNVDDEGLEVQNDGGLDWTTLTGSQTTATSLPAFGTGTKGVVPASPGGTSDYLRADGSWATPPVGTGTVTSVAASGNNGVSISGSPITTSGTITIGLGAITPTSVSASGTVNGSNLSGTNTGDVTLAGTPDYITISGQTITRNQIDLTTDVTGVLPVANGGSSTTTASLSSDFTTSSASFVDVTGLAVTLAANSRYMVLIDGAFQSTNVGTGAMVSLTRTGSPTVCNFERRLYSTATAPVTSGAVGNIDDLLGSGSSSVDIANTNRHWSMIGVVVTSGSTCTIQVRAVRGGAANNISIMQGSCIIAYKLN